MSLFHLVFLGILTIAAVKIIGIIYGGQPRVDPELLQKIGDRLQNLEKRMENLETIVISKRVDLAQEIESLSGEN